MTTKRGEKCASAALPNKYGGVIQACKVSKLCLAQWPPSSFWRYIVVCDLDGESGSYYHRLLSEALCTSREYVYLNYDFVRSRLILRGHAQMHWSIFVDTVSFCFVPFWTGPHRDNWEKSGKNWHLACTVVNGEFFSTKCLTMAGEERFNLPDHCLHFSFWGTCHHKE